MTIKIAACVILYQPDKSVVKNIKSYINYVEKIYVIDNTENKSYSDFLQSISFKIQFIYDGFNEGIAKRLNQACAFAIEDGFYFLLTMDQDSFFDKGAIIKYLECVDQYSLKEKVSMFGVEHEKQSLNTTCDYNNTSLLITSGSIINLNNYKTIGGFDENLFIDFVDTDYCFKSIQNDYLLIHFPNIYMHHKIGDTEQYRSIKNLKFSVRSIHSDVRLYYMVRNFLYLKKKYKPSFKTELLTHKKDLQNRIKNKLLYHENGVQTIKLIITALKDFKQKKMGKK